MRPLSEPGQRETLRDSSVHLNAGALIIEAYRPPEFRCALQSSWSGGGAPALAVGLALSESGPSPRLRSGDVIRFADCELNLDRIVLRRGGEEIRIEPQVFEVLVYLVEHRGAVVRKEELLDAIWGDRFVSESALTTRIKAARQAVGDDGRQQSIIRTVHGKGYEFVAIVEEVEEGQTSRRNVPSRDRDVDRRPRAAFDRP